MSEQRLQSVVKAMNHNDIDALLLSFGFDLPWLAGYHPMPLERITMLAVRSSGEATLFVPALEAPRVEHRDYFDVVGWKDDEDPIELISRFCGTPRTAAISDQSWASALTALQLRMPVTEWKMSSELLAPLRSVKDAGEIEALSAAGAAADRVASQIQDGSIQFVGRTELDVASDIDSRLRSEGHQTIDFVIVGSGPNAASPHHEPTDRVIERGEAVVCDFGGTRDGYCSDTTRTFFAREVTDTQREVYEVVKAAQQAGFEAAKVGTPASAVDAAARKVIEDAGYGEYFIHRLGHGIGVETHEAPYLVSTNNGPLESGNAFSIEPGIYLPGEFGVRIEDIAVATDSGPVRLNNSSRDLTLVP